MYSLRGKEDILSKADAWLVLDGKEAKSRTNCEMKSVCRVDRQQLVCVSRLTDWMIYKVLHLKTLVMYIY